MSSLEVKRWDRPHANGDGLQTDEVDSDHYFSILRGVRTTMLLQLENENSLPTNMNNIIIMYANMYVR